MEEKWVVYGKKADFYAIGEKFHIDPVIARVIRNRDIVGDEEINRYLHADYSMVHSPGLMYDMEKACSIMKKSLEEDEHIRIISDYDVDGVTSNYILLDGLKNLGAKVSFEIPDRILDGYGINERMVEDAYRDGVGTIITCDNGIAAFTAIERAKALGMTVIVTDHHEVPYDMVDGKRVSRLVAADAVVDPKREECNYPFKGLCGAGVAYKFIRCLYDMMGVSWEDEERYIDILAIATMCDVMELVDENRVYVKKGLEIIPRSKNKGIRALIDANELTGKKLSSYHLGFIIGPCINATGRLETAKRGLMLLASEDEEECSRIAQEMVSINIERKNMTNKGVDEGIMLVSESYMQDNVLVVTMPKLHESLAGLVAGRIREQYYKPTIVLTKTEGGMWKGSGRSIEGYHMFDALNEVKDYLEKFGGHEMAAGLSLKEENIEGFRQKLNELENMSEDTLTRKIRLDAAMPISYVTFNLVEQLSLLEPFGKGNEKPQFAQADLKVKKAYYVGKEKRFVKYMLCDSNGKTMEAMDFNGEKFVENIKMWFSEEECDKMFNGLPNEVKLDVVYYPEINEFNGRKQLQLKPEAYRKA